MTAARSDWREERKLRLNAVRGSRKLLRAILKAQCRAEPKQRRVRHKPPLAERRAIRPHSGIELIQAAVAEHYGLTTASLWAESRKRLYARPRQIVMFLAHARGISFPRIGMHFGKDHTTVLHACRAVPANVEMLKTALHLSTEIDFSVSNPLISNAENAKEQSMKMQVERIAA